MTAHSLQPGRAAPPSFTPMTLSPETHAKSAVLSTALRESGSLLVAYSGGTDSAFLAFAAHQALGDRMLAVIADSASLPRAELAAALVFTAAYSIPTLVLATTEMSNADYLRNDDRRCFHCKDTLFKAMEQERRARDFAAVAYGMNVDDRGEFRPGQQAAALHKVLAPLVMAGLSKAEIRGLARCAGLSLADKPASACLSSRIEYGRPVTPENLRQVEQAEQAMHRLGFPEVRVRHHGTLARIEIVRDHLPRALSLPMFDEITTALRGIGFLYIALDTEGYRTGSMNAVLPVSAIAAARAIPSA